MSATVRRLWEFYYLEHRTMLVLAIAVTGFLIAMLRTSEGFLDRNLADPALPPGLNYHGLDHPYAIVGNLPYGILWYAIVEPLYWLAFRQPLVLTVLMYAVNGLVAAAASRKNFWIFVYYEAVSNVAGQANWNSILQLNLPIAWLTLAGLYNPVFLPLAILAKLPIGSELFLGLKDWQFAFGSAGIVYRQAQELEYFSFAIVWLMVLTVRLRSFFKWLWEFPAYILQKLNEPYERDMNTPGAVPQITPLVRLGSGCPRCGAQDFYRNLEDRKWYCGNCGLPVKPLR